MLGVDYEGATDDAAERGHFQSGGMPEAPPGGVTQGVMGGAGSMAPQGRPSAMSAGALSPDYALMMMGAPGARMGLGSMGLLGGTNMHPQPELPLASSRPSMSPAASSTGGLGSIGAGLPSLPRQGFQGGGAPQPLGPNGQYGYYTPGFQPGIDPLSGVAGVPEALFGQESAGSKHPYTGIDTDQINAIGAGEWLPPITDAPMPDWQHLGNTPQFGAAESSLAGMFGGGYTPGSVPPGTATPAPASPAAKPPAPAAQAAPAASGALVSVPSFEETRGGVWQPNGSTVMTPAAAALMGRGTGGGNMPTWSGGGEGNTAGTYGTGGRVGFQGGGAPAAVAIQRQLRGRSGFQGGGTPWVPPNEGYLGGENTPPAPWVPKTEGYLGGENTPRVAPRIAPRVAPHAGGGGYRAPAAHIDPRATALAPAAAGGGARPPFTQVSLMGGRPVSALDLSGLFGRYTPTTGNARTPAYVPPTATAQAPEHPAITAMRHLARAHAAMRQIAPRPPGSHIPIGGGPGNVQEGWPTPSDAPENVGNRTDTTADPGGYPPNWHQPHFPPWTPPNEGYLGGENTPPWTPKSEEQLGGENTPPPWTPKSEEQLGGENTPPRSTLQQVGDNLSDLPGFFRNQFGFQGGGGVMGSSPVQNSAFSTSRDAGFGDLFGGSGRPGFAEGGDPFLSEIVSSQPQNARGAGPPPPPQAPQQQSSGGGGDKQPGSPADLGKLGSAVKNLFNPATSSTPSPSPSTATPISSADLHYLETGGDTGFCDRRWRGARLPAPSFPRWRRRGAARRGSWPACAAGSS